MEDQYDELGDIWIYAEFDGVGGASIYLLRLVELLAGRAKTVTVVCFSNPTEAMTELKSMHHNVEIVPVSALGLKKYPFSITPLNYLDEARAIADKSRQIFQARDRLIFSVCSPGRFLTKKLDQFRPIYIFHSYPRGGKHLLAGPWFRSLIPKTARLAFVSQFLESKVRLYWGINKDDDRVNLIRSTTGRVRPPAFSKKSKRVTSILMVGSVSEEKNPFHWIRVAVKVLESAPNEDIEFTWVGDGNLRQAAMKMVRNFGHENSILFVGEHTEIDPFYSLANLYLHLSKVDSFPLAGLDALRFGLPCIFSETGGLPELVHKKLNGVIVPKNDVSSASRVILELLSDPEKLEAMGKASLEHYREEFDEPEWNRRMHELVT